MKLMKRRFPSYLGGLFIGLTVAVIWYQLRTAFAPKFEDVPVNVEKVFLAPGAKFSIKYKQNPEKHLAWGFPSALVLGKAQPDGNFSQIFKLEYADLVEQEVKIAPLNDLGVYEIRMSLSSCEYPGVAVCWRKLINIPIEVKAGGKSDQSVVLDLLK